MKKTNSLKNLISYTYKKKVINSDNTKSSDIVINKVNKSVVEEGENLFKSEESSKVEE
jgi:hypothetical protein